MGTIVSFHAHPDDESIGTAGTLARAADAGHRVVLVFATRGELGEPVPGVLADGEQLALRRSAECYTAAQALGAHRVEFLGYTDSGMMGEPTNDAPYCFWRAPVEHAARRLAVILDEEEPDVLTVYDDIGGYGHPDHIQVHRVGMRAAELSAVPVVAQQTINRDWLARGRRELVAAGRVDDATRCPSRTRRTGASRRRRSRTRSRSSTSPTASGRRCGRTPARWGRTTRCWRCPSRCSSSGWGWSSTSCAPTPSPAAAPDVFHELFTPLH